MDGYHGYYRTNIKSTVVTSLNCLLNREIIMPTIFRKTPPEDILLRLLKSFGLTSFHDGSWFCKEYVRLDVFEGILLDLEPYY